MPPNQPLKPGSMKKTTLPVPFQATIPTISNRGVGGPVSRSADVSRTGSQNLTDLMNVRSLLEIQSKTKPHFKQGGRHHIKTSGSTRPPLPQTAKDTASFTFKQYLQTGTGKSAQRIVNSEEKLSVISKAFQKTLHPIATQDVRKLIKTPPHNIMETMSNEYDQVLERQIKNQEQHLSPSPRSELPPYQPMISGSMKAFTPLDAIAIPKRKTKGVSRSADVSRTGSNFTDFQTFLDNRSANPKESGHFSQKPGFKTTSIRPRVRETPSVICSMKEYLETGQAVKRITNSEDKLGASSSVLSTVKAFKKALPRRDINFFDTNNNQYDHDQVLGRQPKKQQQLFTTSPSRIEELPMTPKQSLKSESTKKKALPPKTKGGSANVSRTGSKNLTGLMDFRSLLAIQSETQQPKQTLSQKSSQTSSSTTRSPRWIEPSDQVVHLTGTEVHGTLQRSVKSIDQAAKIAQNLGNLMSKVAIQQNGKEQQRMNAMSSSSSSSRTDQKHNDTSLVENNKKLLKSNSTSTSTAMLSTITSKGVGIGIGTGTESVDIDPELKVLLDQDRKRNPYNPITEDIKKRASHLAEVVEQAEQNLKFHGAAFGFNPFPEGGKVGSPRKNLDSPKIAGQKKGSGNKQQQSGGRKSVTTFTTTTSSAGTDAGFQTEVDALRNKINDAGKMPTEEFEFVPDLSYTDQLMLKKLRTLKSTWCD